VQQVGVRVNGGFDESRDTALEPAIAEPPVARGCDVVELVAVRRHLEDVHHERRLGLRRLQNRWPDGSVSAAVLYEAHLGVVCHVKREVDDLRAGRTAEHRVHVRVRVRLPCNPVQAHIPVCLPRRRTLHHRNELALLPRKGKIPKIQLRKWSIIRNRHLKKHPKNNNLI
jgi:hypothetical protein